MGDIYGEQRGVKWEWGTLEDLKQHFKSGYQGPCFRCRPPSGSQLYSGWFMEELERLWPKILFLWMFYLKGQSISQSFPSKSLQQREVRTNKRNDATLMLWFTRTGTFLCVHVCVHVWEHQNSLIVANPGLRLFLMGNLQWRCSDSISIWDYWTLSFTGLYLSVDNQPSVSWLTIKKKKTWEYDI